MDAEAVKVFILPNFAPVDSGEGGIRRVVEAQRKYLPLLGVQVVDTLADADVCAYHGGVWVATNKPVVSHCHGLYWNEHEWSNWAHELNRNVVEAMRRSDVVTAPSRWVAHILQRGMLIDPPVLYSGVDVDEWLPSSARNEQPPYVLWNKTRVDPICTPEPVTKLAGLASDISFVTTFGEATRNVQVTGKLPLSDAKQYVSHASVYLCTTRETFGIGTLEAMACEVPVLGWRWGGQVEIIEHGVTGYLAQPGDYEDLLKGLRFCLENRDVLGRNARAMAMANFSWQRVMESYATIYRQALRRATKAKMQPKVSVVITCYNLANTLSRAVGSVATQEGWNASDTEIVIVNDNSPDDTGIIAENLKVSYAASGLDIRVVTNADNLYLSGALNAGIEAARGAYIVPLDADNELGPRALRVLSDALDRDRSIDIAYGAMQVIDESGNGKPPYVSQWPTDFNFLEQMRHRNQIPSTSMYRRSVWQRVGGYRRRCRTAEDADFWCRATSYGAVPRRVTDAVCLIYHDRTDSMSHVEKDWDWTAWYSWSRDLTLAPFGAAQDPAIRPSVPTYEPALVTVVIPVGPGHGKYLADAIDSLQAQTYLNWRCIVVNDSGEPLPWLPPFVKVLDTGAAGAGPSKARNMGIAASNTHLFLPLDADDYLQPFALELLVKTWRAELEAGRAKHYVYGDFIVQETGERKSVPDYSCELLAKQALHSVTALYPKAAWTDVGFDESLAAWEDWDFAIGLAHKGYCGVRVDHAILYYRLESGSRREDMYANRAVMADNIRAKWPKFLVEREPMACGCGGTSRVSSSSSNGSLMVGRPNDVPSDDLVLLEYTGTGGPRTYRGPISNQAYRFGADQGHKLGYVRANDVSHFESLREFKKASQVAGVIVDDEMRLEAVGPPAR